MNTHQRKEIIRYLAAFDFSGLFTDPTLGWEWPETGRPIKVPTPWQGPDAFCDLQAVAEKRGVQVLLVPPLDDGTIMPSDLRKKLEKALTPLAAEHLLIFADKDKTRQIWLWTSRLPGKPVRNRELTWERGRSNELLLQKLITIAFTLDEEEALDITGVVQRLRDNLDRDKLTKRFYDEFKKHKDRFQEFIEGITDKGIMAHYTSLMLNRLMFCYFLQQKGFLDGDPHYLRNRLKKVRESLGEDQFHSFYRSFLKRLFHEGLDSENRPDELTAIIGTNIPYLNGGIFAEHPIERAHPDIQIPDAAFEKIFEFFDAYQWHLDDRPLAAGNEINPEVLGYVFEKYTNQKEMGAYYTKEDITEYICKNTILPFLLQKVASKLTADSWALLKADPDRYIYEPVRRGAGKTEKAWLKSLPPNIAIGLQGNPKPASLRVQDSPNRKPLSLLERRKDWNTPAPDSHALPTEIWRETIARHQRCHELRKKLTKGKVTDPADLVTLNLDIRQFVQDVIANAPADLALALWKHLHGWKPGKGQSGKAIPALSVLDPTCGSGAFLFAALEILEPLYEGLLERLRALQSDWQAAGEKHPVWEKDIEAILAAVDRHPNEPYFIHKTIIVHNLYGVDIMEEAVEICKLRLFLKLAAQLEPGQAVEPLPDIDFNIRSGNTLVGYASRSEIKRAVESDTSIDQQVDGREQGLLTDTISDGNAYTQIMEDAEDTDRLFQQFQTQQDLGTEGPAEQRNTKDRLDQKLNALRSQLDRFLAGQYDQKNLKEKAFKKWQASHEPFHWFVEFYGIMNAGGFDVIVGNPPYVEYSKARRNYELLAYQTIKTGNLYSLCMERSDALQQESSWFGFIVQSPIVSTARMASIRALYSGSSDSLFVSTFDDRPSKLFEGINHARVAIIMRRKGAGRNCCNTTRYHKWSSIERPSLLSLIHFVPTSFGEQSAVVPKLGTIIERKLFKSVESIQGHLGDLLGKGSDHGVFYKITGVGHWFTITHRAPKFWRDGSLSSSSRESVILFPGEMAKWTGLAILNSTLFYWYYQMKTNCRDFNPSDFRLFPLPKGLDSSCAEKLGRELGIRMDATAERARAQHSQTGAIEYEKFRPRACKPIIDQIDTLLAEHYGFTEEELDFIINYDIKYRMGLSGGSND